MYEGSAIKKIKTTLGKSGKSQFDKQGNKVKQSLDLKKLSKAKMQKKNKNNDTFGSGFNPGTQEDFDPDTAGVDADMQVDDDDDASDSFVGEESDTDFQS